jgi:putative flippase GtrA
MALLWFFIDGFHWHKVFSQLVAILVTTLSNFIGSKLWAFKSHP